MEKLASVILNAKFHVIVFLTSALMLFFSFISELPTPTNHWTLKVRDNIYLPVFITGLAIMIASTLLYLYSQKRLLSSNKPTESDMKDELLKSDKILSSKEVASKLGLTEEFVDTIDRTYLGLSPTQRSIIIRVYTAHKSEVAVDDLYKDFEAVTPQTVESKAELRYRVKDLVYKGLLKTKSIGSKTTIIISIPMVGKILAMKERIFT